VTERKVRKRTSAGEHTDVLLILTPQAYGVTVSSNVLEAPRLPYVPVTVRVDSPVAAEPLTASVNVQVEVAGLGLKDAVTPLGSPLARRVTL